MDSKIEKNGVKVNEDKLAVMLLEMMYNRGKISKEQMTTIWAKYGKSAEKVAI